MTSSCLFIKQSDVLLQNLVKHRSREIGCYNDRISGISAALQARYDYKSINPNLTASRLARSCDKTSIRLVNRDPYFVSAVEDWSTVANLGSGLLPVPVIVTLHVASYHNRLQSEEGPAHYSSTCNNFLCDLHDIYALVREVFDFQPEAL